MTDLQNVKRKIEEGEADLKRARECGQDIVPFVVYLSELQENENFLIQGNPHFISANIHQQILRPIMNDKSYLDDIYMFVNSTDYSSEYPSLNC
jgi:hypothetical protein